MKVKNCRFLSAKTAACVFSNISSSGGLLTYTVNMCKIVVVGLTVFSSIVLAQEPAASLNTQTELAPEAGQAAPDQPGDENIGSPIDPTQGVGDNLEDLKKAALELNRDLLILEEELLFPANTQLVVFLSMDVGEFFKIDSVKLNVEDKLVASELYTEYQNDSLVRGGIHRLYIGNLKQGEHEVTAVFTGFGPDNRKYKRAATISIEKDDDPIMLELRVRDATSNMQPTFDIKEWEL